MNLFFMFPENIFPHSLIQTFKNKYEMILMFDLLQFFVYDSFQKLLIGKERKLTEQGKHNT
jgi:hypothetical protein